MCQLVLCQLAHGMPQIGVSARTWVSSNADPVTPTRADRLFGLSAFPRWTAWLPWRESGLSIGEPPIQPEDRRPTPDVPTQSFCSGPISDRLFLLRGGHHVIGRRVLLQRGFGVIFPEDRKA